MPPYCVGKPTLKRPRPAGYPHSTVRRPSTRTIAMAIDWKRVLSDIPIEQPHDYKIAYFVSPPFSTGGHTSRWDASPYHRRHTSTCSDWEPRAAPQPGL